VANFQLFYLKFQKKHSFLIFEKVYHPITIYDRRFNSILNQIKFIHLLIIYLIDIYSYMIPSIFINVFMVKNNTYQFILVPLDLVYIKIKIN